MKTNLKLIETWIQAQKVDPTDTEFSKLSWASNKLIDMAIENPELLWEFIIDILKYDSSDQVIGAIGSGLLEDLMIYHGEQFIDRIVLMSEVNSAFKKSMNYTFLDKNDVSPTTYKKFNVAVRK